MYIIRFFTLLFFFFSMIRRPPRSTLSSSSAASDVYKRQPQYVQQEEQEVIAPQNNPEKEIQIVQEMQEEINMNQQQQQQQQQQQSSQQQYEQQQQQQQQYEQKQEVSQAQQQQVQQRVQPSLEDGEKQESQVYQYMAPWVIYSIGFSSKPNINYRIGIGSFLEEDINYVQIIKLNEMTQQFDEVFKFEHKYPPTKLMWIPDLDEKYPDILATSGESLKIYEINQESNNVFLKADLVNKSDFSAPLTSFDWNISKQNLIGTASIDTTCTIWDIEKETVYTQLIAHDKEVYDIAFAKDPNLFASVGADGSARQFDLRNLEHSTVLYDTENQSPLLKLGWNHLDPNYVAVIAMDQNDITILDTRMPQTPLAKLNNHKNCVNALAWAPSSCSHICTVADDCQALIWDT
eukprot:TRINITY_DN11325_c0_g1_i14.p1 TRINITY_DN11325_c0_g1~~TRINITY_DN11325_c0_g1_i14.p1  ORF type:complete len:405 (-),score=79.32 TRINITY_DN11325_c0_g1_i14:170-1384(-)